MVIAEFAAAHVAGIVSGVGIAVAIALALRQLRHQRKLVAQRATLDFISKFEVHDQRWTDICSEFTLLRSGNRLGSFVNLSKEEQDENDSGKKVKLHAERERKRILIVTFLNYFECVAVAVRHGISDEFISTKNGFSAPISALGTTLTRS